MLGRKEGLTTPVKLVLFTTVLFIVVALLLSIFRPNILWFSGTANETTFNALNQISCKIMGSC